MGDRRQAPNTTGSGDLEDRRRFLLRSIDDLDGELAAGDLDAADHDVLRADYVARAADVVRRIEAGDTGGPGPRDGRTSGSGGARRPASRTRRLVTVAAVAAVALGAGISVARTAGERTEGGLLTGGDRVAALTAEQDAARRLLASARANLTTDPLAAIQDFDSAWRMDPTLVEAPTYAGWLLRLTAQGVDDTEQRSLFIDGAKRRLDDAIAADPNYPDARAFRGILRLRDLDDPVGADQDFTVLATLDPPEEIRGLVGSASEEAAEAAAAVAAGAGRSATTGPATTGSPSPSPSPSPSTGAP